MLKQYLIRRMSKNCINIKHSVLVYDVINSSPTVEYVNESLYKYNSWKTKPIGPPQCSPFPKLFSSSDIFSLFFSSRVKMIESQSILIINCCPLLHLMCCKNDTTDICLTVNLSGVFWVFCIKTIICYWNWDASGDTVLCKQWFPTFSLVCDPSSQVNV